MSTGAGDMVVEGAGVVGTAETRGEAENGDGGGVLFDFRPSTQPEPIDTVTHGFFLAVSNAL
jgi:hypothetical protein